MKAIRITWFAAIFALLIVSIGQVQHSNLGTALALIGISLIMTGMSLLAEWYAGGSR